MPVTHALTSPTALLLRPLLLTLLLTLTSGSDRGGWGREGRGGGEVTSTADLSGHHPLQQEARGGSDLCDTARLHCTVRMGCQRALSNLFEGCGALLSGEEWRCSTACQHALVALLSTEDGAGLAFMHCDCGGQPDCEERKQRVQVCQRHVLRTMDLLHNQDAVLSCRLARGICEADTSCLAALQYYVQHCSKLFTGTRCTAKCRNSVHILYRQPKARKLRSCRCDGDEGYDCQSLLNNTERLCLQRHRHHRHHHHHHNHSHRHHHRHVPDNDEVGEWNGLGRRPGREPGPITQSHTSGHTSVDSSVGLVTVSLVMCVTARLCSCFTLR